MSRPTLESLGAGVAGLAALAITFALGGQAFAESPTVVVIGAVHEPSAVYTAEVLTGILERLQPDLVLLEGDPSFFDGKAGLKKKYRSGVEGSAATAYQRSGGVAPQPFDIEGRDRFYKEVGYFSNESALLSRITALYQADKLSPEAKALFEAAGAFSAVGAELMQERPEVINSAASDAAMKQKQFYVFDGIARIIAITPELKEFASFWEKDREFWVRRNDTMVRNILGYIDKGKAKTVVVLCGFEHRNYLRNELAARAVSMKFVLREFWEGERPRAVASSTQSPGFAVTPILRTALTGDEAREAVIVRADFAPDASTGRHSHPGDEYATVLEGTLEVSTRGKPTLRVEAGKAYHNARGAIHETRNVGEGAARVVSTFIVDKDQPLVRPAPEAR